MSVVMTADQNIIIFIFIFLLLQYGTGTTGMSGKEMSGGITWSGRVFKY